MSHLPVFFTALAEEDLDQIEDYISAHDPAAVARVRAAIVQQSLQLENTPKKGTALNEPRSKRKSACASGRFLVTATTWFFTESSRNGTVYCASSTLPRTGLGSSAKISPQPLRLQSWDIGLSVPGRCGPRFRRRWQYDILMDWRRSGALTRNYCENRFPTSK